MHTEHLHRTLSPQAYASLQDLLRHQAKEERRLAVQTCLQAWTRQLLHPAQRMRQAITRTLNRPHTQALEA